MAKGDKVIDITGAMLETPVPIADWLIVAPVVLPMLGGAIILMARRQTGWHAPIAIATLVLHFIASAGLLSHVMGGGPLTMTMGRWLPPFGISFTADLTGALLCFAASLVGLVGACFATIDIETAGRRNGFFVFLLLLMCGISGSFLTGDLFNLYVWFEVVLISSFGMIVLGSRDVQLDGTIKYAFLNFIATTLFLAATAYLYGTVGTLNMADITLRVWEVDEAAPIVTIAALFFVAFAMKAAAFPLNFWLPASYHTPNIVVSALFAGLLTKVGIYALLRTMVMLLEDQQAEIAFWMAITAGATMIFGVFGALAQSDIRRLAGYLVIAGIGSMLAGIAIANIDSGANRVAITGVVSYALHSIVVMTAIYFAIGVIGRKAGTFDLRQLGGHYAESPFFAAGFLALAVSVSGLPPFSGFWPKLLLVRSTLESSYSWLAAIILFSGLLTSIAIIRVWAFAFWRGGPAGTRDGAEAWKLKRLDDDESMIAYLSIGVLVIITFVFGIYPEPVLSLSSDAANSILFPDPYLTSVFGDAR